MDDNNLARTVYESRLGHRAKVIEIIQNGQLDWPEVIKDYFWLVVSQSPLIPFTVNRDTTIWKTKEGNIVNFSIRQAWFDLSSVSIKVL